MWMEDHAEALTWQGRELEEAREFWGFVPPRIQLWDGYEVWNVVHLGQRPRHTDSHYLAKHQRYGLHGPKAPEKGALYTPPHSASRV